MEVKPQSKEAKQAKDGHPKEDVPGPKSYLATIISKVTPKDMTKKEADPVSMEELTDKDIRALIAENPRMDASTFYNLLKSKGAQITAPVAVDSEPTKESDSASAAIQVTRAGVNKEGGPGSGRHPEHEFGSVTVKDDKKKGFGKVIVKDDPKPNVGTVKHIQSGALQFTSNRFLESVKGDVKGVDGNPKSEIVGFTKFKVVLLQEGMGNFRDAYWYSKDALASAVPVFEGAKIYADHPSAIDEATRPERTVRDILGNFEDVHLEETEDGTTQLVGTVNILGDESYRWARSLMEHAVDFAQKYPDKEFIGLSINANGDANEIRIDDLISQGVPQSSLSKLVSAKEEGIDTVKIVSVITDATSCDLVTEAGAGGKVLQLLEGDKMKHKQSEFADQQDPSKLKGKQTEKHHESEDEDGAADHADEQQDIELIKKMIAQHLGDDHEASEEECGLVKEAYEAHKEMGEEEDEAVKKAVSHLKLAKHLAAKKEKKHESEGESEAHKQNERHHENENESESESEDEAHKQTEKHKESMLKLKAENASLRESLRKIEINSHINSLCEKSKLPTHVTKSFREAIGAPKSVEEVNKAWKLFETGFRKADAEAGGFDGLIITSEKQTRAAGSKFDFTGVTKD